jgi:2-keto-4-pentenoate hydratase/2-oxohepta-3-ene-1,7-dioic acid hydratase in catechol pathway
MKLITFQDPSGHPRAGWLVNNGVVDMQRADPALPADMLSFIDQNDLLLPVARALEQTTPHYRLAEVRLLAPLPNPRSVRDFICFEEHMLNTSKTFGHTIGPAWYEMPIFYFTNHHNIFGPEDAIKRPAAETRLDFEIEMGCILGKRGKNIHADEAEDYIFGYTVYNDWTARAIQRVEMTIPLGPHKGKDFANAFGPCIVTRDEMKGYLGDRGRFDVRMIARINGAPVCEGNFNTIYFTFGQMIERASENDVWLLPGDILGSGTVGGGSLIEHNFAIHRPLEPGDAVELEIEGIGVLRNYVV